MEICNTAPRLDLPSPLASTYFPTFPPIMQVLKVTLVVALLALSCPVVLGEDDAAATEEAAAEESGAEEATPEEGDADAKTEDSDGDKAEEGSEVEDAAAGEEADVAFAPAKVLGYDLACSACEVTVDKVMLLTSTSINKNTTSEEKLEAAQNATKDACAQLVGVSMIGTYPGRKYDAYGSYGSKAELKKAKRTDTELDAQEACEYYIQNHGEELAKTVSGVEKFPASKKETKKIVDGLCVQQAQVCGAHLAAAAGAAGNALCLVKALKDGMNRKWEKATKHAARCLK